MKRQGRGVFSVTAPISGYVIAKHVTDGMTITEGGDPLFTIANLDTVWIVANIYASSIPFVRTGMDADISSISYPGQIFTGKVDAISHVFDPEDKALKARIIIDNADLKFKPGMSVEIRFHQTGEQPLIAIPADALIFDNNKHYVITRPTPDRFTIQAVDITHRHRGTAYISSGIQEGDEVVTKNQLLVYAELKGI